MSNFASGEKHIFNRLKIKHLQVLVAVADCGSVGEVASSLHVTQPAISKLLAEIERGLGLELFERSGRGIRPNEYGNCLVRHARQVLAGLRVAHEEMRALSGGLAGRVKIGMLGVAAGTLMPEAIRLLKQRAPAVTVRLQEGTFDQLLPELHAGRLDLIVGRLVEELRTVDLMDEVLFEDPVVIAIGAHHPLAGQKAIGWADLQGQAWILPPEHSPMYERLQSLFVQHRIAPPSDVVESISLLANLALLSSAPRVGLLPASLARQYVAAGALRILPLAIEPPLGPVGVVWMADRTPTPAVALMQQAMRQASGRAAVFPDARGAGHDGKRDGA